MFEKIKKEMEFNVLLVLTLMTGIIFVYSTYAWFSSSLNVVISDFRMTTHSTDGIYISLDGVTWSSEVNVTENNLVSLLTESYPGHKTQWAQELGPVSAVRIQDSNQQRYNFYTHKSQRIVRPSYDNTDALDFFKLNEDKVTNQSRFVAFDVFIKNITPSPYSDNLYIDTTSSFTNADPNNTDDTALNALRMAMIFSDVTSVDSDVDTIQNLGCNGRCRDFIFEPYAYNHSEISIKNAQRHGVNLVNGNFYETYGMIKPGDDIKIWSGVKNDKVSIDPEHYILQDTMTSLERPIFQIPKGIVKARIYIWVEGQDIDIIEHISYGYKVSVSLNFRKDHASLN